MPVAPLPPRAIAAPPAAGSHSQPAPSWGEAPTAVASPSSEAERRQQPEQTSVEETYDADTSTAPLAASGALPDLPILAPGSLTASPSATPSAFSSSGAGDTSSGGSSLADSISSLSSAATSVASSLSSAASSHTSALHSSVASSLTGTSSSVASSATTGDAWQRSGWRAAAVVACAAAVGLLVV
ncbi:hypothetical protein HK405_011348 [Cladochytrium tenue]|nr:hypothetical protein HK405_011348 [Cladochytrium tenue]